jgi:hypothetical protein
MHLSVVALWAKDRGTTLVWLILTVVVIVALIWGSVKLGEALYRQTTASLPSLDRLSSAKRQAATISVAIFIVLFTLLGASGDYIEILPWPVVAAGAFHTLTRVGIRRRRGEELAESRSLPRALD